MKENRKYLLLCIFGGWLGLHKFYKKQIGIGILYMLTYGLFLFGWFHDIYIAYLDYKEITNKKNITLKKCKYCNCFVTDKDKYCPNCGKTTENANDLYNTSSSNFSSNKIPHEVYFNIYRKNKADFYPNDYIVIDTETTGLKPENEKIIEISAIKYINGEPIDYFSKLVNPQKKLSKFISELTGIKDHDLINEPTIDKILPEFFKFIGDFTLVAHNISFDIEMIACEAYRNNINMVNNKLIDTVTLAKKMIPENKIENYKLSTLKDYFEINIKSHRATEDCEMCNIVYQQYLKFIKNEKQIINGKNKKEVLQNN